MSGKSTQWPAGSWFGEEIEDGKNIVCLHKERNSRLHIYSLIPLWYFVAFSQVLLQLTYLHTLIFKVSVTLKHFLLRALSSLKHLFSKTCSMSQHVIKFVHVISGKSELWSKLLKMQQCLHLPWGTCNPHLAKCQHVWPKCYSLSVKVLLITSAELEGGFNVLDIWHTVSILSIYFSSSIAFY